MSRCIRWPHSTVGAGDRIRCDIHGESDLERMYYLVVTFSQTGAGTSMSKLGWADLAIATLDNMRDNAEMIASLDPSMPVIADADTGYGGPIMVSRTVAQYARSGVAALHIEDQVSTTASNSSLDLELIRPRLNKSGAAIC